MPAPQEPVPVSLPAAAALSGLSPYDVWVRYAGLGGRASEHEVAAMLADAAVGGAGDHALLARVLEAHLLVLGCRQRVRADDEGAGPPPVSPG